MTARPSPAEPMAAARSVDSHGQLPASPCGKEVRPWWTTQIRWRAVHRAHAKACCLALPLRVKAAGAGYVELAALDSESAGLKLLLRLTLASLVVLVPAVLMGATLPALAPT